MQALRALPAVDTLLNSPEGRTLAARHGRQLATDAIRQALDGLRQRIRDGAAAPAAPSAALLSAAEAALSAPSALRPVLNLTGTVLHTNLGRALLADEAIAAATDAMRAPLALEMDLDTGQRGERDDHLRHLLIRLTGAEDATVVNNNAAAVLLALNTLGQGRDALVSRGELIEIGGAFRMPDIMARAGVTLREVGTTNRTHPRDFTDAITGQTGLILKVHTSNYRVEGFTCDVSGTELARIGRAAGVPVLNDLGSGSLVDLSRWGLRREPTVAEAVAEGADVITFSGDKLLGGPQAGFIVGSAAAIAAINRNPMKRALRLDKLRIAAIEATLRLYLDPDRLTRRLPTLRFLARAAADIRAQANRLAPHASAIIGGDVAVVACASQIGSGALPIDTIPSAALRLPAALAAPLRRGRFPVLGRIHDGALLLDLRCLTDEQRLLDALTDAMSGASAP